MNPLASLLVLFCAIGLYYVAYTKSEPVFLLVGAGFTSIALANYSGR